MRLAWAHGAAPTNRDARPLTRQQQILAAIRALADQHDDEPTLRVAWAKGVSARLGYLVKYDGAGASSTS
jgi:hypothetical protein